MRKTAASQGQEVTHFRLNSYSSACGCRSVEMVSARSLVTCALCKSTPAWQAASAKSE